MNPTTHFGRRDFLKFAAALGAIGATCSTRANAAAANDYKALVCIYLAGGCDGNNLIVPLDAPWNGNYMQIRSGLALSGSKLLTSISDAQGQRNFGLHYGLPKLKARYGNGVAFVLNTGVLHKPLTQAQYLAGDAPSNLFSHSDQSVMIQSARQIQDGTGWGGRLLDVYGASSDPFAAISTATPATLLQGAQVAGNVIPPGSGNALSGMSAWDSSVAQARNKAVSDMTSMSSGNTLRQTFNKVFSDGLVLVNSLKSANLPAPGSLGFPTTSLGQQLEQAARLIAYRASKGPGRQIFICTLSGFDTHAGQDWQQYDLFWELDDALDAFQNVLAGPSFGLAGQVTTFTQSEFGRSLQPSGTGSDHGWGNHQMVVGGAVQDGIYGSMPDFTLGGPDDANSRGVWIPKIGQAQFAGTLGKWFGAGSQELLQVLPELANFSGAEDLGFMG